MHVLKSVISHLIPVILILQRIPRTCVCIIFIKETTLHPDLS